MTIRLQHDYPVFGGFRVSFTPGIMTVYVRCGMRLSDSAPFLRRWPLLGLAALFILLLAILAVAL